MRHRLIAFAYPDQKIVANQLFLELHRRYSGYCAWRGVLEASNKSVQEVASTIKSAFPDVDPRSCMFCLCFLICPGKRCFQTEFCLCLYPVSCGLRTLLAGRRASSSLTFHLKVTRLFVMSVE
ncbi:hypothetical protein M758_12G070000 [Ceratodon purpureus]|nr:hypothetical protein M758_12G070000 [Ceratodon purpureus]